MAEINRNSQIYVLKTLKAISNFAVLKYNANLSINFTYWKPKRNRKCMIEPFSKEQIKKIVDKAKENLVSGKRDTAIIILAYTTGLRSVDISNLTFEDINWRNKSIKINQKKTSVPVQLPLNSQTIKLLSDYILNERPNSTEPYIFLTSKTPYKKMNECWSMDSMLRKYFKAADMKVKSGQSMHSLRRAFASELSNNDVALTTISQLLGHQDLDSDKPYLTYNICKTMQCAISFSEIPLMSSVYSKDGSLC